MATAGNLISKSNFSTSWAYTLSNMVHGNKDQTRYVYICAASWCIDCWATYYAFWNSGIVQLYFSYWNGSSWSSEWHYEVSGTSASTGDTYFAHNYNNGSLTADLSNAYPLWRLRYWPSRANSNWGLVGYAGGYGVANANYPTGKPIRSIGRAGDNFHAPGSSADESNMFNNIFNPTNRRGSFILASNDSELISYPY